MSQRKVAIKHPQWGVSYVLPESLGIWRKKGWSVEGEAPIVAQPVILEEIDEEVSIVDEDQ